MKNWRAVCLDGFIKEVKADSREEVVGILLTDPEMKQHMKTKHPELNTQTVEQRINWILALIQLVV